MNSADMDDYPNGDLRVSDADRERALSDLTAAFESGRITAEEFDERSTQALSARTGGELTALFTDLRDRAPAKRGGGGLTQTQRLVATRVAAGATGVSAVSLTAVAISNAVASAGSLGPSLAVREAKRALAQQVLNGQGISIKVPLPPPIGFDWAGAIAPAAVAVLLFVLTFIFLRLARIRGASRGL
jgi:hypothetical protein